MAQKHNQYETQNAPMTRLGDLKLYAQQRIIRGTAFLSTSFTADNPILQLGELGYETDTNKLKIGDGVTAWNDLAYAGDGGSILPSQTGNAGKFLTTDGTDTSWADIKKVNTTTLAADGWEDDAQTVNVAEVTATNTVFVSPAPASAADYASAGIICTAQGNGTLTFTCTNVPSNAITVNVVCF